MKRFKSIAQFIKKPIVKITIRVILGAFATLFLCILLLQIPFIQTKVVHKLSNYLSEKIGFNTQISYANIRWFDAITLEGVKIFDTQDSLMIGVEKLNVDFKINTVLFGETINLDQAVLTGANVQLIRNTDDNDLNINLFIYNINQLTSGQKGGGKPKPFEVEEIILNGSTFRLYEPRQDSIVGSFDYRHFKLSDINANIESFLIAADTVQMVVNDLTTHEKSNNLFIKNLSTHFRICNHSMSFDQLELTTEYSQIRDSVVFTYNNRNALNYFNDSVNIAANLSETIIFSRELAVFAPAMKQFEEFYKINGHVRGKVSSLHMQDISLTFGEDSRIEGNFNIDGLPNFQESFIDFNLKKSFITTHDLLPYLRGNSYQRILRLGDVHFYGEFLGFPYDFVANGTFETKFGKFDSDINLKVDELAKTTEYSGNLKTFNFDLGELVGYPDLIQQVSMNGNIVGSGLSIEKVDFDLNATIEKIGIKHYNYQHIETNAHLAKELFQGKLEINDPNLKFSGQASIDFRANNNLIEINARLDTLLPKELGLISNESFISTTFDLDLQGNNIDDMVGNASFSNTSMLYANKNLNLDTLHFFASKDSTNRKFELDSKEFSLSVDGNYNFTRIYYDLNRLIQEYKLNFENDQEAIEQYYSAKKEETREKYTLDYEVKLKDINPYLELFNIEGYISKNTMLSGNFSNGYTSMLSAYAQIDTIIYKNNRFYDNEFDLSTSKLADSANVLAMTYLHSSDQSYRNLTNTDNISMEAVWNGDVIQFTSAINQTENNNRTEFNGALRFLDELIVLKLAPSNSRILDKIWQVEKNNSITFVDQKIIFDSLTIQSEDQFISLNGTLSDNPGEKLRMILHNFKVENLNPLLAEEYYGIVDGQVDIQNSFGNPVVNSSIQVSGFKINKFLVGNFYGLASWEEAEQRARMDFEIERTGKKIMDLRGYFYPKKEQQLDMSAEFIQTDINVIEPFLDEYITEITGQGTGEFDITGTLSSPILRGNGILRNGTVKINYLNTKYFFDGDIHFDDNEIGVRDLVLKDDNGQQSTFVGGLFHDGFKDFIVDFQGNLSRFKVLNTNANHNKLYYGTAIVSGDIEILGSFSNLNIFANAKTEKGTKFFIPINSESEIEKLDFIRFVEKKDSVDLLAKDNDEIESVNIQRLNMDFNLEITSDAYSEIIFDLKAGDIIRGRSNGKLKLQIDPQGDFNMFGGLDIVEGAYNFTLKNIINKEFTIKPNSKIDWYGDPYGGIMDIKAFYAQQAALSPLFDSTDVRQNPDLKRKYPAKVLLDLQGDLLNPAITFDLDFESYPFTLSNSISELESRLNNDEQELSRQVFSLVMLRKFSPLGTFDLGGGHSVSSSVSELLSNQLSYWITQVDENLEIDVDLGDLDEDAFNTFQLRLSYSFLDGRLRVTRDGGFTDGDNNAGLNSIVGDWTVEYLLTPDGKLKAKMYNKNNYYSLNTDQQTSTTAGFSIQYTENFDKLGEIWKKARSTKSTEENVDIQGGSSPDVKNPVKNNDRRSGL